MRISNVSVFNVLLVRNIQKILPNLHFQYGTFFQVHGKEFTSTMQDRFMVQFGWSGSTRTVNTVVRNKYQVEMDSTQCENSEKSSPCLTILSKSYRTMELHSLHVNSANSAINTESGISDQHRITLQRTERPNASYKSSNVHFGRIKIKPRTVHLKPQ